MKRKLYYTIELGLDDYDSLDGNKIVTVYSIENNEPKQFCSIDCQREDNSKKQIQSYLDDNGFGDEEFEFVIL